MEANSFVGGPRPGVVVIDVQAGDRRQFLRQQYDGGHIAGAESKPAGGGVHPDALDLGHVGSDGAQFGLEHHLAALVEVDEGMTLSDEAFHAPAVELAAAQERRIADFFFEHGGAGGKDPVEVGELADAQARVRLYGRRPGDGHQGLVRPDLVCLLPELLQLLVHGQDSIRGAEDGGEAAAGTLRMLGDKTGEFRVQLDGNKVCPGPARAHQGVAVEHAKNAGPAHGGRGRPCRGQVRQDEHIGHNVCPGQFPQFVGVRPGQDPD
ncbi:hypothetical protein D9M72_385110 [compost metagenome]